MFAGLLLLFKRSRAFVRPPPRWASLVRAYGGGCTTWVIPTGPLPFRPWPAEWCLVELDPALPNGFTFAGAYQSGVSGAPTSASALGTRCARCGIAMTLSETRWPSGPNGPPACAWCASRVARQMSLGALDAVGAS